VEVKRGIPVSPGIAIGEAFLLEAEGVRISEHFIAQSQVEQEIARLDAAMDQALVELQDLAAHVSSAAGPSIAEIFSAHAGMLSDPYFRREFHDRIREKRYAAEFSVSRTMRQWRKVFQDDAFLATRVPDLDDLERRLLRLLLGSRREELASLTEEVILMAHDLSPSQTATLDTRKVKGIAIDGGGPTGHTAIIARALGIPAVVGLGSVTGELSGGDTVIVDGTHGVVIVDPTEENLASYQQRRSEARQSERILIEELREKPAKTTDGHRVRIFGNIESPREVQHAVEHGAEGIGLYRTELLYLTSDHPPTEEDHYAAYMEAVDQLDGRPIIIRTVDLGADKFAPAQEAVHEKNPFLGRRSIRYCLDHPDVLSTQLRAILRASAHGDVRVMFPLITSLDELQWVRATLESMCREFDEQGLPYDREMQVGIMIEVPSAAVYADVLARHVDFFSIGTNDLIQYTLAIDRANEHVAHMYRPIHPSVLRLIKMTTDAAHQEGIEVGICGEMGSEVIYAVLLLGLGVDHFSVSPPIIIPELKKAIRSVRLDQAQQIARELLEHPDMDGAMALLLEFNRELMPLLFP
jgi:phosphotransferase system enzyme I (PtsI)